MPVGVGEWVKAEITLVKPLNVSNTIFEVTALENGS